MSSPGRFKKGDIWERVDQDDNFHYFLITRVFINQSAFALGLTGNKIHIWTDAIYADGSSHRYRILTPSEADIVQVHLA